MWRTGLSAINLTHYSHSATVNNTHIVNVKSYRITGVALTHTDNGSLRVMIGLKVVNVIVEYSLQEEFMVKFNGLTRQFWGSWRTINGLLDFYIYIFILSFLYLASFQHKKWKTNWCHCFNFIPIWTDLYMFRAHRPIFSRFHTAIHTTIGSWWYNK